MGVIPHPAARNREAEAPILIEKMRRAVRELLGHKDVKTTMIYTHVLNMSGGRGIVSPVDSLHSSGEARP